MGVSLKLELTFNLIYTAEEISRMYSDAMEAILPIAASVIIWIVILMLVLAG
jgi:hypothetical protein